MSITAARLQAEVGADTKGFDSGMAHADSTIKKAPGKWATALKVGAGAALAVGGALIVRGIAGAIRGGLASLTEQGVVIAQTNAAIRSTKGAANVSAGAVRDLSTALEAKSGFDDKAIQSGANLLLTFTNVRNEAGKGNDIFNQSTEVLTNMARAMGTDVRGGAIQLGKALNDPLKGITALTRVGVTFDATQKKQIANFMKAGKVADAQKIILAELNKEFGKSNEEFMKTDAGKALLFQDAIENVQQKLAGALLPALTKVRGALTDFLGKPETLAQAAALGDAIGAIFSEGNLKMAADLMTTAAGAIGTAIKLFGSLPPELQALAVGALALKKITGIGPLDIVKGAGGVIKMIFERGATPANPLFVADVAGGVGRKGVPGGGVPGKFIAGTAISAAALVGTLAAVWEGAIMPGLQSQAGGNIDATEKLIATGTLTELRGALAGLEGMPGKLDPLQKVLYDLNASGIKTHTESLEQAIRDEITSREATAKVIASKGTANLDKGTGGNFLLQLPGAAGVIARAIAKGNAPKDSAVIATLEKNRQTQERTRQATREGTFETSSRIGALRTALSGAVTASGNKTVAAANATTAAALATAAAIRAKEFTAQVNSFTGFTTGQRPNPKPSPVPVILSPRAVPNAVRLTDLYGPTSPRNGRAIAS